jgi:ribose transport system permease protein
VALAGLLALFAGSLVQLLPAGVAWMFQEQHGLLAVLTVLLGGALIGLFQGVLITRLRLQPFIVTLCGLFIWRGLAYWLALPDPVAPLRGLARFLTLGHAFADSPVNSGSAGTVVLKDLGERFPGLDALASGFPPRLDMLDFPPFSWFSLMPERFWLLLGLAAIGFVLLHLSVYGRYLFAVGANEQAARYAGIDTDYYKVLAYMLCSTLAALGGVLQMLELKSTQPSTTGLSYELYAITGAVLGGCSLRGGEGTIIGMLLGTTVLPLLNNLITLSGLPGDLEFLIIGLALLSGTILDELLKRRGAKRGRV